MEGREWSGFDMAGKCDIPDRKFSVPAYNEASVKLRDKRDTMPSSIMPTLSDPWSDDQR